MLKKLFFYPSKNIIFAIFTALVLGFMSGYFFNTSFLKNFLLPGTILMIYPTMIGIRLRETFNFDHGKVLGLSMVINFIFIPALAYILGSLFLMKDPQLFAGLATMSLLPTSGMTVSWTMINKGNVPAAVKITVIGLLLGALLTPWYLLIMIGEYVPVDLWLVFRTIFIVIFIPLLFGNLTFKLLLKRYTFEQFKERVKPFLPATSVWFMLFVLFCSASLKAKDIISQPQTLILCVAVLYFFYLCVFITSTIVGRMFLSREGAVALVYGSTLRNLSLGLGIALNAFGAQSALIITLAYIIQVQWAAGYGKALAKFNFFKEIGMLKTSS